MVEERQIIIDVEIDTPYSILNFLVEFIKTKLDEGGHSDWITDVYWDEI